MTYLIASDLDGTLLNDDERLSQQTLEQLQHAKDEGHTVVAATGRSHLSAIDCLQQTDVIDTIISSNGAYHYSILSGEITRKRTILHSDWMRWVSEIKQTLPDACFAWQSDSGVFYDQRFIQLAQASSTLSQFERDLLDTSDDLLKLLIRSDLVSAVDLQPIVGDIIGNGGEVCRSGAPFVEATAVGATKGVAVSELAASLDISAAHTVAFGDNYNDESMIRWAGMSYAMGNAVDVIKQLARFKTLSNSEDGVAVALETLLGR